MDMQAFYRGSCFDAQEYLGAHPSEDGVVFRTYAPNARAVSVLYAGEEYPMKRVYDGNFFELTLDARVGACYEYRIYHKDGGYRDHADPYGFAMELRPAHRSVICDLSICRFHDQKWMSARRERQDAPLNIYEMHLGSWQRGEDGALLSYEQIAGRLIPYLKEAGYNYVEFLPLSEHPCDESWGYQNTGFFAATSRYGSPLALMQAVDLLHQNDIGVILDFVPVHFAVDDYALAQYDGTALYEYPHAAVGVSEWGSYNFNHSRGEVRSFLQSAANFFLSTYHFDGLRIDALSRTIYWQGDERRGENGSAIDFIKVMNMGLKQRNPGVMLIAEDSTHYPGVTKPVEAGGLGFDYKWDMGWMHDTLEYFQTPFAKRVENYHKLTFSMMYYYGERYLLALSHDEVVHGKATVLQKMCGEYADKFPQARAMYLYMTVHPGKKLNFMGNEFGQLREWDERREQDHSLRQYPIHDSFYRYIKDLNAHYLTHTALSAWDHDPSGFSWIDCHREETCVYVMSRKSQTEELIALFNFSDSAQEYTLPAPYAGEIYRVLLHTDWEIYGGKSKQEPYLCSEKPMKLPRFSGLLLCQKQKRLSEDG